MKFLCAVFTLMVLLLAVRPCCADNCANESSTAKSGQSQTSSKEKECAGCSPFFACGTCVGFVAAKTTQPVFIMQPEVLMHTSSYQQPQLKEIALSIWQPPRLG